MTTAQRNEFIKICMDADDRKLDLISDLIICVKDGGDAFWDEAQKSLQKEDKDGLMATIDKWTSLLKTRN